MIPFSLKGTDGKIYSETHFSNKDIPVIIFMCNHCPYVIAVIDRLVSLQSKFSDKKVKLIGINPNDPEAYPRDSFENMKKFALEHGLNFPYLVDETQETAKKYDAVCTPDIFVYDRKKELRYRGRIDDNWKDNNNVTSEDLSNAITSILNEEEIKIKQYPSMGCSIKWKK